MPDTPRNRNGSGISQIVLTVPPVVSMVLSFPAAENAMNRLLGDQNGNAPASVPDNALGSSEFSGRSHSRTTLSAPEAAKTSCRPSGDKAKSPCGAKLVFSGIGIPNRTTSAGGEPSRKRAIQGTIAITAISEARAATLHAIQERVGFVCAR